MIGAPYPIWREVQMHPESALDDLHVVIQAAMDWDDAHLHMFVFDNDLVFTDRADEPEPTDGDESEIELGRYLTTGSTFLYRYDFGDNWHLRCTVKFTTGTHIGPPRLLGGAGDAPAEDSGGVSGFAAKLRFAKRLSEAGVTVDDPGWIEPRYDELTAGGWDGEIIDFLSWWNSWGRPHPFDQLALQQRIERTWAGEEEPDEDDLDEPYIVVQAMTLDRAGRPPEDVHAFDLDDFEIEAASTMATDRPTIRSSDDVTRPDRSHDVQDDLGPVSRVRTSLKTAILDGVHSPGQTLPGKAKLGELFGVAPNTAMQACLDLHGERLIYPMPRGGWMVAPAYQPVDRDEDALVLCTICGALLLDDPEVAHLHSGWHAGLSRI